MKVAVVGLGIAGLSICARLAEAGHDVDGFEQFELMHAFGSSHGDTRIMRLTPGEGEIYVRLAEQSLPLWQAWEHAHGAPLITWTGGLMLGPPGSPFVASCRALSQRFGRKGHVISIPAESGFDYDEDWDNWRQEDCGVIAADATRAFLIAHAGRLGARWHKNVRIAPIDGVSLRIDDETRTFDAVIVSAGGWAGKLLPEFAERVSVKRRVMAWFRPLRPPQPSMPVLCVDDDCGIYGMPTPEGLYKLGFHTVGDTVDPDDVPPPNAEEAAMLSQAARAHLPLHNPEPVRIARCLYTVTPDENFLIASSKHNARVLLFSACSGHGFKYAPAFGALALDWLEGRANAALDAFSVARRAVSATGLGGGHWASAHSRRTAPPP